MRSRSGWYPIRSGTNLSWTMWPGLMKRGVLHLSSPAGKPTSLSSEDGLRKGWSESYALLAAWGTGKPRESWPAYGLSLLASFS